MHRSKLLIMLYFAFTIFLSTHLAQAQTVIVHAVLFFSPSCNHCHFVIEEVLPPLAEEYGNQLEVIAIDVTTDAGAALYQTATISFQIPEERLGIPTLIIGDQVLWGRNEIAEQLASEIESGLLVGGVDWPDIPGLQNVLIAVDYESNKENIGEVSGFTAELSWKDKFAMDPIGNSFAVIVLIGMVLSGIGVTYDFLTDNHRNDQKWQKWAIPLLIAIGITVSFYLTYVEVTKSDAVCGPIGDCGSVQESPYAHLFGIIPVGFLGLTGYALMMLAWLGYIFGPTKWRGPLIISLWGMAWFGLIFSIYLTFLEPFVIGATCAWCITSAIVITLLLWSTTGPALSAMRIKDNYA